MLSNRALELFQKAATEIPAYKQFLADHSVDVSKINDTAALKKVPLTSKKNYLVAHPHKDLVWSEDYNNLLLFCSTSGSTGKPYYFPRNEKLSEQYSYLVEDFLKASSYGDGSTLVLVGFGMGVWIGGIITLRAFEMAAARMKQPVALLPVGYNKTELFKALKDLAPEYEQTVLVGYPPFIKEIIDEADDNHIDLKKLHIRTLFAAESFTETFRNYICEKAGIKSPVLDTLNIYGTADIGAMAYETPLSILTRRLIIEDPLMFRDVFKQIEKTPTLAQFNPNFIEFEDIDDEIVLTGNGALPLIRYAVGDHGGVLTFDQMKQRLKQYGVDLEAEIKKAGISDTVRKYPFVFVYERADLSATLHGILIYPEYIKEALLKNDLPHYFTERFTMSTKHDIHHNQFLQVNLELQPGIEPTDDHQATARKQISLSLIERSSEYAEVSKSKASKNLLQVVLWPNGHPRYFTPGVKQKWVEKA